VMTGRSSRARKTPAGGCDDRGRGVPCPSIS